MAVDDYMDSNVAVAVAATTAALSPPVRKVLHRGAVYGVTGVLMLGDLISGFGRGMGRGLRSASQPLENGAETAPVEHAESAKPTTKATTKKGGQG